MRFHPIIKYSCRKQNVDGRNLFMELQNWIKHLQTTNDQLSRIWNNRP